MNNTTKIVNWTRAGQSLRDVGDVTVERFALFCILSVLVVHGRMK